MHVFGKNIRKISKKDYKNNYIKMKVKNCLKNLNKKHFRYYHINNQKEKIVHKKIKLAKKSKKKKIKNVRKKNENAIKNNINKKNSFMVPF